jgi:uncharacterized protein
MPGLGAEVRNGRAHFAVRLTPRSSREVVGPVRDGVLCVHVTAAPVKGAANVALIKLLGKALRLGTSAIRIERGATSVRKRLSVPEEALERLRLL